MEKHDNNLIKFFTYRFCITLIVLFFIVSIIGCDANEINEPELNTAKVIGKISGENDSGYINLSDYSHIHVSLVQLKNDGNEKIVSTEDASTDSEGKFVLETNLEGIKNLLVKAEKDNFEWRGIVTSTLESGIAVYLQPLNRVTTISSDLYKLIFVADSSVGYNTIGILINDEIASILNNNKNYVNGVAEALKSEFDTEKRTFLKPEIGGTASQWNQIMSTTTAAQCALDRDLYFAESESAMEIAFRNYLNSISDTYIEVGLTPAIYSKVFEVSSRILLKDIKDIDSGLEFEFVKRSSEINARILNIAIQHEFQMLDADPSLINKVIFFGDELENGIKDLHSQDEVENAFDDYKDKQIANLVKVMGIAGVVIPELQDSIAVYKDELKSSMETGDENAIINSYLIYYSNIATLVERQIHSENINQSTIVEVLILLNTYF